MTRHFLPRLLTRVGNELCVVGNPRSITLGTQIGDNPVDSMAYSGDSRGITGGCHVLFISSSQAGQLLSAQQTHPLVDPTRRIDLVKQHLSTPSTAPTTTTRLSILA